MNYKIGDKAFGGIIFDLDLKEDSATISIVTTDNQHSSATWNKADSICEKLKLKGYNDWTLPTIFQLRAMKDLKLLTPDERYWTSNGGESTDLPDHRATINTKHYTMTRKHIDEKYYVRAVRTFEFKS